MNRRALYLLAQFLLLFALWVVLSQRLQPRYLLLGALSAALVTWLNRDLGLWERYGRRPGQRGFRWGAFLFRYLPWLLWQIILANLQVAYLVLHPRLPIDPRVVVAPTRLHRGLAQVLYANSITLTPGTITVDVARGIFVVHALSPASAGGVESRDMERRVAELFDEPVSEEPVRVGDAFPPDWGRKEP